MKRSFAIFSAVALALSPRVAWATIESTPVPMAVADIVKNILTGLLSVTGALFFVMFLWGGVTWLTAGGDAKKVEGARKTLSNAVIGMIIVATSYAIVQLIAQAVGSGLTGPVQIN